MPDYPLTAAAIKNEFKRAGIHFVVALPDRVTSHYLLKGLIVKPRPRQILLKRPAPLICL